MDNTDRLVLREDGETTRLTVRAIPRAGKTGIDGVTEEGALRMRLNAPPVDGAANAALIAFLADLLNLPKREIAILRGARSREKVVAISAPVAMVRARLRAAGAPRPRPQGPATPRG